MISVGEEIPGIDMHILTEVESGPFKVKLLILGFLVIASASLSLLLSSYLWILPSIILGIMYAHAIELQHQCLHNTALRDRKWNRRIGVTLGLPLLVSYSDYQNSHMKHHKNLGTPEDREFFNYGYEALTNIKTFIPHIFMVRHNRDVAVFLFQSYFSKLKREASHRITIRIRNEYRLMVLFLISLLAIAIAFDYTIFLKLWLVPFLIGVPVHALIELPEHIGCNVSVPDVLKNTRTIKAGWFGVWLTDGNNYHVEHHWLPGVPNHKFPELHKHVNPDIETLDASYVAFYRAFLKMLIDNKLKRNPDNKPNRASA